MQIGVITVGGRQVGVVSLTEGPFAPDLDGYMPQGRAAEAADYSAPHGHTGAHLSHRVHNAVHHGTAAHLRDRVHNKVSHGTAAHLSDRAHHHTGDVGAGAAYGPQDRGNRNIPASLRYNNPGAQWPSEESRRFGQTDAAVIGGGNRIAGFPTPVHGAASNIALLQRGYVGRTIGHAIHQWSGGGRSSVPGFDSGTVITPEMARDPQFLRPFMHEMAAAESGRRGTLTDAQIDHAIEMVRAGSAAAYERAHPDFVRAHGGTPAAPGDQADPETSAP